jgi:hypothetical protein
MKRRIALSIALALSLLMSLVSLPATAQGQQQPRRFFVYDPGVVTPGAGQILRITVVGTGGNDAIRVRFRRMQYMTEGCNSDGVCRQSKQVDSTSPLLLLNANEAASIDIPGDGSGVRVRVESNSREARVVSQLLDAATGSVIALQDGVCTETEE